MSLTLIRFDSQSEKPLKLRLRFGQSSHDWELKDVAIPANTIVDRDFGGSGPKPSDQSPPHSPPPSHLALSLILQARLQTSADSKPVYFQAGSYFGSSITVTNGAKSTEGNVIAGNPHADVVQEASHFNSKIKLEGTGSTHHSGNVVRGEKPVS